MGKGSRITAAKDLYELLDVMEAALFPGTDPVNREVVRSELRGYLQQGYSLGYDAATADALSGTAG